MMAISTCWRRFSCLAVLVLALRPDFCQADPDRSTSEQGSSESLRAYVEKARRRQAYGVYVNNQKFGWAIDELKLERENGQEVAVHLFEIRARFNAFGELSEFQNRSTAVFELDGEGSILRADEWSNEDGQEKRLKITREGDRMKVTTISGAGERERWTPVPKESLSRMRELERWLTGAPPHDSQFESFSTNWEEAEIDLRELYTYRGKKSILWGGVPTDVHLVTVNMGGMLIDCEVASDGTPIKGKLGGLLELRAEEEAAAKETATELIDMLQASSIKTDKNLGDPEDVDWLMLRIDRVDRFTLPTSHRQRIRFREGASLILETFRDHPAENPGPLTDEERKRYLQATPALTSDHPTIRNLANEIGDKEQSPLKKAERLKDWVYRHVRQTMTANTSTALDVLHTRAGDCTEITLLFLALARAAGLPAREVGGIVFSNEPEPLFGWHAWAEIHDGSQWVSIDPTWNQVYVDATHIKLAEDSNDWAWVNLLGAIRINVLDFKSHK